MLSGINEDLALPLLTQRPVLSPQDNPHKSVYGRRVLVTGAGGSIGSELVKQIVRSSPSELVMVDRSEYALYEINETVAAQDQKRKSHAYLTDVRDHRGMDLVFRAHKPDVVFHAAALKHVPLMENMINLIEAVGTNVIGTKVVADLCIKNASEMVLVSTDKAVNPSSVMGLTKRVAEVYLHGASLRNEMATLRQVRFGNVFGSSGSVVPLFRRQIAQGGPVTVTHRNMTRFMMTISDAVQLVLQSSAERSDGYGCYVLDMGKPVRILDLAERLIELAGLTPHRDIKIEMTGLRPGEKLDEELYYKFEKLVHSSIPGVFKVSTEFDPLPKMKLIGELVSATEARSRGSLIRELLTQIVPEYAGTKI
jgi:FlaA1/EpsC-like NDP-sugar epimerase